MRLTTQSSRPGPSVRPSRPRVRRRPPLPLVLVLAIALLSTAAGVWLLVGRGTAGAPTMSGLSVELGEAGWVNMDAHTMDNQGGFQMPAQMMPGAPEGDDMRLGVPLVIVNTSDVLREFDPAREFTLVGGVSDAPVQLHSDTFGLLHRLNPGSAVNGVLYFDTKVPSATDPPLVLRWTRDGRSAQLAITWVGAAPTHTHGP